MEEIYKRANLSTLVSLVDVLSISLVEVNQKCQIVAMNRRAKVILEREGRSPSTYCKSGLPGVVEDCKNCPVKEVRGRKLPFYTRKDYIDGEVQESFFFPSDRDDKIFIASIRRDDDVSSENLLKQGERLKRVIFDNLSSSFLFINREGDVERSHFVDNLGHLLGRKSYSTHLSEIFNSDISESVLAKVRQLSHENRKDLIQFRLKIEGQTLWLNFHINHVKEDFFFVSIDDKSRENQYLERLEQLTEVEINCQKVNELSSKVKNLTQGILGYTDLAMNKSKDPIVKDILDSLKKLTQESTVLLETIDMYTKAKNKSEDEMNLSLSDNEKKVAHHSVKSLSVDQALERLENNWDLYNTIAEDFLHDYKDGASRLKDLLANDLSGARLLVHSIKGVAGIIGAYPLQDSSSLLEGYIRHEQWENLEEGRFIFSQKLELVLSDLKKITKNRVKQEEKEQWSLHGITLIDHQKDRLLDLVPLIEISDYNNLMEKLNQFSSFDWGEDWTELIRIIRNKIENIDFDGALQSINTLV